VLQIGTDNLGAVYGVSGQRIRLLKSKGAPVGDPDALLTWLKEHGSNLGPLLALLLDAVTRADLHRRIQFICSNELKQSHPQ
jgi:hypothetical protein